MHLYFTRHGETEWNRLRRVQGQHDSPLTETGREQARNLRKRLRELSFTRILVSPLGRARTTAEILAKGTGLVPEVDDRLAEECLGDMEEKNFFEQDPELVDAFQNHPERFIPPHGETHAEAYARVADLLKELEQKDENVLIVSHALITRQIRLYLTGLPMSQLMKHTGGCCYCEAEYKDGSWKLLAFGDDRAQNPDYLPDRFRYFGSMQQVDRIPADAVLTPFPEVAAAYGHAPQNIRIDIDGKVTHDGSAEGYLYRVALPVSGDSVPELMGPAPWQLVDNGPQFL